MKVNPGFQLAGIRANSVAMLSQAMKRYVPLAVWMAVILTLVMIPGKIMSYGFLPADDALRHAAKAVCGKPWPEILVMRSDFTIDPHPGWHVVLGAVHRAFDANAEALVVFSVVGLMLLLNFSVLPWLGRPEAWLAVLMVVAVCIPSFISRMMLGRPYLVSMVVFMTALLVWRRMEQRRPGPWELVSTVVLIAAAAWIHGSFYLLIMPAAALLVAGRWRQALEFGACWLAGSVLGASLTGHPWQFLGQCLRHLFGVFGDYFLARQLVVELLPSDGDFGAVLVVVAMLFWRALSPDWKASELRNPLFLMGVLGWVLGLKVVRFWSDWGLPAMLLWLAFEFQKQFAHYLAADSLKRLTITCVLALGVFLGTTSDRESRWTANLTTEYLTQDNPELAGWLPEPGGILYSADMRVFNNTFFKNPNAPWRYVLGFESALMLPEDLAVVRKVDWNYGDVRAYAPWVQKMGPKDRLTIRGAKNIGSPNIPELEWHYAVTDIWIGRKPRVK